MYTISNWDTCVLKKIKEKKGKMKKLFLALFMVVIALALFACGESTYEIAMITDIGDIDDQSFNQGTWEGIEAYAVENGISHKYYKPTSQSLNDYVAAIDLAVEGGAKVVVTPGFLFENAIHKSQSANPEVKFVLIDGSPHNVTDWDTMATYDGEAPDFTIADNTLSIFFKEQESGFFAGYAAYKDGLTSLGFVGGLAVPAVVRFGVGFVAGAYYAAEEEGDTTYSFDDAYYMYAGGFAPSDTVRNTAASWYAAGVEAIHAAAGGAGSSVMTAAEAASGTAWVVGVDVDQASQSDKVITSAMKGLGVAVQTALAEYYADEFQGGESITLGAAEDAVGLPTATDSWRFATFTVAEYDALLALVAAGTVVVPADAAALATFVAGLGLPAVSQDLIDAING